jgi:hypothetical protein
LTWPPGLPTLPVGPCRARAAGAPARQGTVRRSPSLHGSTHDPPPAVPVGYVSGSPGAKAGSSERRGDATGVGGYSGASRRAYSSPLSGPPLRSPSRGGGGGSVRSGARLVRLRRGAPVGRGRQPPGRPPRERAPLAPKGSPRAVPPGEVPGRSLAPLVRLAGVELELPRPGTSSPVFPPALTLENRA